MTQAPTPLRPLLRATAALALLLQAACASVPEVAPAAPAAPATWSAPLPNEAAWPHEGRLGTLVEWWRQQVDPTLAAFIEAAQQVSPSISSAQARRAQAQAESRAATSALLPQLDAVGSAQRRSASPPFPAGEIAQGGLQMSWEIDLFGGPRAQRQASYWRLQSADAAWHEARVLLAADVAAQVLSWRHCSATLLRLQADAQAASRGALLLRRLADAGLQAPDQAALGEASAAEVRNRARAQAQRCETDIKILVQYTAWPEERVRATLNPVPAGARQDVQEGAGAGAGPEALATGKRLVPALPAATLAQRPDVFMAAAGVAAAAAEVGVQQAQRFPRVGLAGSIGRLNSQSAAGSLTLDTWSVGPLSLSLPVFDAGRRAANVEAARARYDDALRQHAAVVRRAVREVEEALTALQTTDLQAADGRLMVERVRQSLAAVELRHGRGLASELEVQEARRRSLGAEVAWLDLQRNRFGAWIALYRAAGGGWSLAESPATAAR